MKKIVSLMFVFLLSSSSWGQYGRCSSSCPTSYYQAPVYNPPAIIYPTTQITYYPVTTYVAGYYPPPVTAAVVAAPTVAAAPAYDCKSEMKLMQAQIDAMKQWGMPKEQPYTPRASVDGSKQKAIIAEVNTSCLSCHNSKKAEGKFNLEEQITLDRAAKMYSRVTSSDPKLRMPPNVQLSEPQKGLYQSLMVELAQAPVQ